VFEANSYKLLKTVKFKDDADNVRYIARTGLAIRGPRREIARRHRRQDA